MGGDAGRRLRLTSWPTGGAISVHRSQTEMVVVLMSSQVLKTAMSAFSVRVVTVIME